MNDAPCEVPSSAPADEPSTTARARPSTWRVAAIVAAAVAVHGIASATFPFRWSSFAATLATVSPEVPITIGIAAIGARRWPRLAAHVAAALLLLGVAFGIAREFTWLTYEVTFELALLGKLPALFDYVMVLQPPWVKVLAVAGLVLAIAAVQWLTARALRCLGTVGRTRAGWWLAAAGLGAALLVLLLAPPPPAEGRPFVRRSAIAALLRETVRSVRVWLDPAAAERVVRAEIAAAARRFADVPRDLARVRDVDVHVLVIESYGAVAWRHAAFAPALRAAWAEWQRDLARAGFTTATALASPAIAGAASWLSHCELLTAARTPDDRTWRAVLASELTAWPRQFASAGHDTVEVEPAMWRHWPEGQQFYGFATSVTQLELGYDGTAYHWGRMPDQFALHHLLTHHVAPATRPVFSLFVSVTSHAPWSTIPPYVVDWNVDAAAFRGAPARTFAVDQLTAMDAPELVPAYGAALHYALQCAIGFTCRLPRPSVVIVLGDHQPPLRRALQPVDSTFHVPVHVLTNRAELLAPLEAQGFVTGTEPPAAGAAFELAELAPRLSRAWSR